MILKKITLFLPELDQRADLIEFFLNILCQRFLPLPTAGVRRVSSETRASLGRHSWCVANMKSMRGLQRMVSYAALCRQDSGCPDALECCSICSAGKLTSSVYTICLCCHGCSLRFPSLSPFEERVQIFSGTPSRTERSSVLHLDFGRLRREARPSSDAVWIVFAEHCPERSLCFQWVGRSGTSARCGCPACAPVGRAPISALGDKEMRPLHACPRGRCGQRGG